MAPASARTTASIAVLAATALSACSVMTSSSSAPATSTQAPPAPVSSAAQTASANRTPSAGPTASSTATSEAGQPSAATTSPSATPATPSAAASSSAAAQPLACEKPTQFLLQRVEAYVDPHPGGVTASAMVRAATTATGTWYVVAIERRRVDDNNNPLPGRSAGVGLTNMAAASDAPKLIPLGSSTDGTTPHLSWSNVSWTGDRLLQGKRAATKALSCIGR